MASASSAAPYHGLKIGFYSNHLCERGSEVALYDYADYAESLCGATAFILFDAQSKKNVPLVVDKFRARFGERVVALGEASGFAPRDIEPAIASRGITHCYIIKYGHINEPPLHFFGKTVRTLVHAVFDATSPHGSVYARISPCVPWQVKVKPGRKSKPVPVVPHIVRPADRDGADLRAELGIPADATVFGRHGGEDTFSLPEARSAVLSVARQRGDIFFLLMNTRPVVHADGSAAPRNVIHLPPTADEARKAAFIRTCDAMLHARGDGETFGLAVAEFSAMNKPVLTSEAHTMHGAADFHLRALGDKALLYHDQASCVRRLLEFDRLAAKQKDWHAYRRFAPERVMAIFMQTFVDGGGGAG